MLLEPRCRVRQCRHYQGVKNDGDETTERNICAAFPDRIPDEIAYGDNPHIEPVGGDHDIQYERESGA